MESIAREKAILVGLFLSKYDREGLRYLGFETLAEAYNSFGLALGVSPQSIKNYRDEFDPLFPNARRGRTRAVRAYCLAVYHEFGELPLPGYVQLLRSLVYANPVVAELLEELEDTTAGNSSSFAKRLITGVAAEQYFRNVHAELPLFQAHQLEDTTALGCGFDFRLVTGQTYFGVEVKGLNALTGTISLTEKEHRVAQRLGDRYVLFVVKNFRDKPFHELVRNPLESHLTFRLRETQVTVTNWTTTA